MALDDLLRGSMADEEFDLPSPTTAPAPKPKPEAPTKPAAPSDLDDALDVANERGEALYGRAEDLAKTLGEERASLSSLKPPSLTDLEALIKSKPTPAKTDPLESFSSAASLAAIFGSLFTRAPLTNALNNAAGVIEAYKARDLAAAKSEFDLWKANLDNAETLYKFQSDAYDAAFKKLDSNSKSASDEMRMLTSAFDDTVMKPLIEQGKWRNAIELQERRAALQNKIAGARPTLADWNTRYSGFLTEAEELGLQEGTPEWLAKYNEWMTKPRAASGSTGEGMTGNQVADNARQEWKLLFGESEFDMQRQDWMAKNPGKTPPTPSAYEKTWLKERGLKMEDGRAVPISEAPSKPSGAGAESSMPKDAPAPRALPAQLKDYPDGSTFESGGWLWTKQGDKAVATERIDTFTPTTKGYTVKREPDGTLTVIPK